MKKKEVPCFPPWEIRSGPSRQSPPHSFISSDFRCICTAKNVLPNVSTGPIAGFGAKSHLDFVPPICRFESRPDRDLTGAAPGKSSWPKDFPGHGPSCCRRTFPKIASSRTIQTNCTLDRLSRNLPAGTPRFNVSIDGPRPFHECHRGKEYYGKTDARLLASPSFERGCRTLAVLLPPDAHIYPVPL